MSLGLSGLVPAAELLNAITGGRAAAVTLAARIVGAGGDALPPVDDDLHRTARSALVAAGVLDGDGEPRPGRAAELVTVCEILAALLPPAPAPPREARIVFSAPPGSVAVAPDERLDGLVLDVIRCASCGCPPSSTLILTAGRRWAGPCRERPAGPPPVRRR